MPMPSGSPTDDERDGWDIEQYPAPPAHCPPTTEAPCPSCSGRGSVITYDVEEMTAKRKALRLSQSAVARAAGWQASIVSELESGARPMTEASAQRYWKALHEAEKAEPQAESGQIPWARWLRLAREKAVQYDLRRVPRDLYREQWALGSAPQQAVEQIRLRRGTW